MTRLEREYRKVKAALDPIRARAEAAEDVREAARSFRRSLTEKMLELEPQARDWIRRARALAEKIESEDALDPVVEEFEALRAKVEDVRARAREDETISHEWQAVRRRILDKMRELDSRVPELVAERNRIVREMKQGPAS